MSNHEELVAVLVKAERLIKDRYSRMLSSISHRFDTDDLYQVTCVRAVRSHSRCKGTTSSEVLNWVMKIAANQARTAITAHKVSAIRRVGSEKIAIGKVADDENGLDPQDSHDAAALLDVRAKCEHMLAVLERLPRQRQAVLRLRYLDGLSYRQIAERLEITESAARTSVSQALLAARAQMGQWSLPGFE